MVVDHISYELTSGFHWPLHDDMWKSDVWLQSFNVGFDVGFGDWASNKEAKLFNV